VTPDTTRTELVTEETMPLRGLVLGARHVLFDFDGPICRLFARHKAERVAGELIEWLEGQGLQGLLTDEEFAGFSAETRAAVQVWLGE